MMERFPPRSEWLQLVRYYAAAALNLVFGYLLFACLVWLGLQVFVAQALGYVLGVIFNYVTYSRIAFADKQGAKAPFVVSYIVNYLIGVFLLWLSLRIVSSPYLAGLAATIMLSFLNYFLLSRWVFQPAPKPSQGL
ncbi:MAG: GtrA family protein [Sphingomonadales bacterium]|nr:GtrA family protein [Sphingomonadales bacterium]NCQ20382.1 GtrA family protein [Sphingomonadales bacterium]NCT02990.1 GtrA family protein [Sphingomonadales bacterium]